MTDRESQLRFEAHLAEIVDGTAASELLDLIAADDDLRDERHAAEEVVRLLSRAADDFDMRARLSTPEVEARGTGAVTADAAPAERRDIGNVVAIPEKSAPRDAADAVQSEAGVVGEPAAKSPVGDPPVTPKQDGPAPPSGTDPTPAPANGPGRRYLAAWVTLGLAAAFGVFLVLWNSTSKQSRTPIPSQVLGGTISSIDAPTDGSRVEVCQGKTNSCRLAKSGIPVKPGTVVRTNARAKTRIQLDGGASMALDRSTVVTFTDEDADGAGLQLNAGTIVIDAATSKNGSISVGLSHGRADLEHANCSLSNNSSLATVEVTRGKVRLFDRSDRETQVYSGETARLQTGRETQVTLNRASRDGDRISEPESEPLEADRLRGLGELRAKKPGETDERKNAVRLSQHHVDVHIVGAIAKTEIDETFTNDTGDVLEGIFRFPLPADAQIERLALEVDGRLVEGAFTDRERASAIWRGSIVQAAPQLRAQMRDEIVWVPGPWRDPALLEWQRGNRFELKIYPIPKHGSRRVVLTYTEVVPGVAGMRRYSYPLPNHASDSRGVEDFSLKLEMRGHETGQPPVVAGYDGQMSSPSRDVARYVLAERRFLPRGDLLIDYELPNAEKGMIAWAHQPTASNERPYVAMLLRPKLPRAANRIPKNFAFVVDTSRSMFGESLRRAAALTTRMVSELSAADQVTLLACDTECRRWPEGLAEGGERAAVKADVWLRSQTAEGASDLTFAVDAAREALGDASGAPRHIIYVGDGTPTVGPTRPATIQRDVQRMTAPRDIGITAIAIGTDADLESLRALARGGRGVVLPYVPGTTVARASTNALASTYGARLTDTTLELPAGFSALAPEKLDVISAGDELLVAGRLDVPQIAGDVVLRGRLEDKPFEQRYSVEFRPISGESNAFVPRLFAAARIADLERRGDSTAKAEAIDLSRRFSVASRYTSLLVLESQAMFDAFGLDNRRKAEVWTGELEDSASSFDAEGGEADAAAEAAPLGAGPGSAIGRTSDGGPAPTKAARAAPAAAPAAARMPEAKSESSDATSAKVAGKPRALAEAPVESARGGAPLANASALSAWDEEMERQRQRRLPQRAMIPMRRIWERKGELSPGKSVATSATASAVLLAEQDVAQNPDRREATRKLFGLYSRSGALDKASDLAERWSQRDPLDVEALIARADIAARRGDRTSAIRILGSVVDVRPSDYGAQQRLSRLYRWQGQLDRACRFNLSLAEFRPNDEKTLADALRCLVDLRRDDLALETRSGAAESVLRAAERLLSKPSAVDALNGDLRINATWSGSDGIDLDLSLIDPDAHRVSWLGAPTRAIISATSVKSQREEGLALRGAKPGEYLLEITRGSGSGRAQGTLTIHVAGTERVIPFSFENSATVVGLVKIYVVPRLVPINGGPAWIQ